MRESSQHKILVKDIFLQMVKNGFNRGSDILNINKHHYEYMSHELSKAGYHGVTPYITRQKLFNLFIAYCVVPEGMTIGAGNEENDM